MRRWNSLLVIFLCVLLTAMPVCVSAQPTGLNIAGGDTLVASGTVTRANCKISAVDGTAFVDFTAANVLTTKIGHRMVVKDSTGKMIQGVIKAAGTGETLDVENCSDPGFDAAGAWNVGAGWAISGGVATGTTTTVGGTLNQSLRLATPTGKLYKFVSDVTTSTSGSIATRLGGSANGNTISTSGTKTDYLTGDANSNGTIAVITLTAWTGVVNSFSVKQVLTPSATGATIVSTKGGSTFNWSAKDASFNYNDASGYTYQVYKINTNPVVASGDVDWLDTRLDLTADNAFVWLNGVDLTAYQDGKHYVTIYSKVDGKAVAGWISATAPAGETLDSETVDNGDFAVGTGWDLGTGWSVSGGVATHVAGTSTGVTQVITGTVGAVYKLVSDLTISASYFNVAFGGLSFAGSINSHNSTGTKTEYRNYVAAGGYRMTAGSNTSAGTLDNVSVKRVLDPPSTGARIVSTKGGATRAFWYNSGLTVNSSGDYSYQIRYMGD